MEIIENWRNLKDYFQDKTHLMGVFRGGLDNGALLNFQKNLRVELPDGFLRFFEEVNGQTDIINVGGPIFGLRLMKLDEIQETIIDWKDVFMEDVYNDSKEFQKSTPKGYIREEVYNEGWIPFATDQSNNYLALDLNPDVNGLIGQVINFGRNQDEKFVIANSLEDLFDKILIVLGHEKYYFKVNNMDGLLSISIYEEDQRFESDPFQIMRSFYTYK